jgi:hypothetical protein
MCDQTFNELEVELQHEGYEQFMYPVDREIAEQDECPICGGRMSGRGYMRYDGHVIYRAFAFCITCDHFEEF